jgi:hypothetical protein
MLPLKNGILDMEIKEHQKIVFCITQAIQDGLTTIVTIPFILFVRVISVSKIQATILPFYTA